MPPPRFYSKFGDDLQINKNEPSGSKRVILEVFISAILIGSVGPSSNWDVHEAIENALDISLFGV